MNGRLPRLTPVIALLAAALVAPSAAVRAQDAANPAPAAAVRPANVASGARPIGDQLLLQAIGQLDRRSSVTAKLRHQIILNGQQFNGLGSYWQQGSGEALRVRLELQIPSQKASLLQVANSRFLWIDRNLPTGRIVSRCDLQKLRSEPDFGGPIGESVPGQATWSSLEADLATFRGGIPSLLAALRENFTFLPPQPMRLAVSPSESSQQTTIPVFAFAGHWRPQKVARLIRKGQQGGAGQNGGNPGLQIPERMPEEVLVLIGQADLFPYRIEYRKLETQIPASAGQPAAPYQLSANPMVVLELSDVAFDVPIAAGHFDYTPGNARIDDLTSVMLERVRARSAELTAGAGAPGAAVPAVSERQGDVHRN